jgi:hypothetical protein
MEPTSASPLPPATSPALQPIQPANPSPSPKRIPLVTILLILIVLLSLGTAGFFAYQNIQLKNQLSQAKLTPTITPSPTAEAGDPMVDWKTYTYQNLYFKFPNNWNLEVNKKMPVLIQPNDLEKEKEFPNISLYSIANPKDLTIENFQIEAEKDGPSPNLYSSTAEIRAVSGVNGYYQKDQGCEPLNCDIFSVSYKQNIYVAQIIYPAEVDEALRTIFSQILSTFRFIDPSEASAKGDKFLDQPTISPSSSYTCPASGWVDCMPILDEAKKKACSPEAMTWYKANCPNFQGGAM